LAKKTGEKYPDKVNSKINKRLWLNPDDVFAGIVREGIVEEIIDKEFDMIKVEQIDSVSRLINSDFDFLYQLEMDDDGKL
jgi:hypothetical protein